MRVDILLTIAVPILARHYIFMLHSRLGVSEFLCLWQENLVVRVLYLYVLLLNDSFHSLVILKVESFLSYGLQEGHQLVFLVLLSFLHEAL